MHLAGEERCMLCILLGCHRCIFKLSFILQQRTDVIMTGVVNQGRFLSITETYVTKLWSFHEVV